MTEGREFIGLDVGQTKIVAGLVSERGRLLRHRKCLTDIEGGTDSIVEQMEDLVRHILPHAETTPSGIGIGSPGKIDLNSGAVIRSTTFHDKINIPLKRMFGEEFGLPVMVENDTYAASLGEHLFGSGRGYDVSTYLTISSGVGSGTCINGRILHGAHGDSGRIAHIKLFSGRSDLDQHLSGRSIAERASRMIGRNVSTAEAFDLASKNDKIKKLISRAIRSAALMVALIQNTIDPEVIIIGGGVAVGQKRMVREIKKEAEDMLSYYKISFPHGMNVVPAKLGNYAGVIGAASLFLQNKAATIRA